MKRGLNSTLLRPDSVQELRDRFVEFGLDGFTDYDALRLLLSFAMPKRSTGPISMALMKKYRSFRGALDSSFEDLLQTPTLDKDCVTLIKLARSISEYYLRERIGTPRGAAFDRAELLKYLRAAMIGERNEQFRVIFLDRQNKVICDEKLGEGTVDSQVVYPRRVIERAIANNATGLIFAHNHPGGGLVPSVSDREVNERLVEAAKLLDLEVQDHFIITREGWYSFREHGMI